MFARLFLTVGFFVTGVGLLWLTLTPASVAVAAHPAQAGYAPKSPATVFFIAASTVVTAMETVPAATPTPVPTPTVAPTPTPAASPAVTDKSADKPPIILIFAAAFLVMVLGATLIPFLRSRLRR